MYFRPPFVLRFSVGLAELAALILKEGLAEFNKPVELAAARGKKRCGHRLKGWKIRVSKSELDARPCILP
jgi:hypothetical protein